MAPRRRGRRSQRRRSRTAKKDEQGEHGETAGLRRQGATDHAALPDGPLTDEESSELKVLQEVLDIKVDGAWEKQTMGVAFARLEKTIHRILTRDGERGSPK